MSQRSARRVVFISNCGAEDRFVIQRVAQVCCLCAVLRPVASLPQRKESRLKKVLRRPFAMLTGRSHQLCYAAYFRLLQRKIAQDLFAGPPPNLPEMIDVSSEEINTSATVELLKSLKPDVLFVSGAPILKRALFRTAKVAAVNVHYGIAPHYRGEHTLFWPLRLADFGNVGITLHYLTNQVDGGPVLARGYPELSPTDSEATIRAKCCRMVAGLLVEFVSLDSARNPPEGVPQDGGGVLVKFRDRRVFHDVLYLLLGRRPPKSAARIERYF